MTVRADAVSSARRTTARAAVGMGAWTAVSRGFGFVRVLVVAAVLGTTYLGNAFQAANSVSNVLFELLAAGALSSVLVPTFVRLLDRGEQADAERLAGGLLGVALALLGGIALVAVLAAPVLADLLTAGVGDPAVRASQQELVTFLLRFFVPQVLLYAAGAIAIAVLHARRRFIAAAAAPIANTVVMVAFLAWFRVQVGADGGLDLPLGARLTLAAAGTLGVAAYVAVLLAAARASGFHLRPRWLGRDPALGRLLRLSGWGVLLHTTAGVLLGTALVVGNSVEGGVVAYQVAFVFFLAPYAILAQPIHTAVLPELSAEAERHDSSAVAASLRWSVERMALFLLPASAAAVAFARPAMDLVAFGDARDGVDLLAAALAALCLGLLPYGAFLLLARGYYALGDSRTPALVALLATGVGAVAMLVGAAFTQGAARVAALGVGHSVAYLAGSVVLAVGLRRRTASTVVPGSLTRIVPAAIGAFALAWGVLTWSAPEGRLVTTGAAALAALVATGVYVAALRVTGRGPAATETTAVAG